MATETIHFVIAFAIGLIIGVVFVGNAILWYYNRKDDDEWLEDDNKFGY